MRRPLLFAGIAILGAFAAAPLTAQGTPFLVAPTERGMALRWVWDEGARPAGYFVERRTSTSAPWTRLTPQPLTRIRDRAAARARLGDQFDRYAGLLFPDDPRAERSDPETFRSMLMLSADLEPGVAHVLGLRYDDESASPGSAYEYRLVAIAASGQQVVATSGAVVAGGYRPAAAPQSLTAVTASRGTSLRWTPAPQFSGYHVYRGTRRDGTDARRLNDAPVILFIRDEGTPIEASATFFTDTAPPARDSAYYRVEGIDAFGRRSQRTAATPHLWRSIVTLNAPVLVQTRARGDTIVVSWQPPSDTRATSYQLWRAASDTGPFVRVGQRIRAPVREHRDAGRPEGRVMWYRVTSLDDAGRESDPSPAALAEIPDRTPPPVPDSIVAVADTGRFSLRWRHVAAPDLRGYRVYRAPTATGTFALLSPTPQAQARFVDTVPVRADHPFYYRIAAVDSAFNESVPSAVVIVRPPDITPPSSPKIGQLRGLDAALAVTWMANPEPDVVGYRLRFRGKGEPAWRDVASTRPATQLSDTIPGLAAGRTYEVTLVAVDDAGNASPPASMAEGKALRRRALARPDLQGASFEQRERGVVVWWSALPEGVVELLVLRREEGQALRAIGAPPAGVTRFVDRTAKAGREYEYVVRARDAFGNASESRARRVQIPEAGS